MSKCNIMVIGDQGTTTTMMGPPGNPLPAPLWPPFPHSPGGDGATNPVFSPHSQDGGPALGFESTLENYMANVRRNKQHGTTLVETRSLTGSSTSPNRRRGSITKVWRRIGAHQVMV